MLAQKIQGYFKPEVQKNGEDYFRKGLVHLSIASDTQVQAFIKAGTGARVHLAAVAISSSEMTARCTCPIFSKGSLCKHIWATLLAVEKKHPDFLDSKSEIVATVAAESPGTSERKAKQAEFKKAQSARLKERNQQQRLEKKQLKRSAQQAVPSYPPEVQAAFDYFDENGFPLKDDLSEESIRLAKKKLARIFHPDLGGHHKEITTLNHYSEILMKILD
ncbi:MAG: SWIM zinc finger domain-containing protein [Pseudobdellovibrionaceae bacterium]